MWDNSTPLQLLKSMPKVLEEEHLEKLQLLLEADKYKNQLLSGTDLCGSYAPFCNGCNKENKYPCAIAYANFMKSVGMDIEIPSESADENPESLTSESTEEASPSLVREENSGNTVEPEEVKTEKTKIRIAIARKKTLL